MTKEKLKNIALILAFVLLIVITYNVIDLKKQVTNIENDRPMLYNLQNDLRSIQNEVNDGYDDIEELLEKEQSLFSETSVDIKLKGSKLAVTMSGVPKAIDNSEKLIAKITTGDKIYEQEADENGSAVIVTDMTDVIKPMFIIKSDTGVRQEALPEQYTHEALTFDIYSEWDDDNIDQWKLNLWILKTDKELPFTKSDVAKAEFILVKTGIIENEKYEEEIEAEKNGFRLSKFNGISIPAEEISSGEGKLNIGYTGDFSEYGDKHEDIYYDIYFVLTTKDGIKYTSPYNSVASFTSHENGSSKGCGDDIIRPIFE